MDQQVKFKKSFEDHYKALLGDRYKEFKASCQTYLRRAIRVNTLKIPVKELKMRLEDKGWILDQVPWCKEGFWVSHKTGRRDIGNEAEHQLGLYYVQEPASMIPAIVLDPKPTDTVLDMCAAPGSKSSHIAQLMENKGALVTNDQTSMRLKALGFNLTRCGVSNAVITQKDGRAFNNFQFDRILVDAPCSGTGTIRKSLKTLIIWNAQSLKRLAGIQRVLLQRAYENLKPGGVLVYSTCSVEPMENEAVVDHFLENNGSARVEPIKLEIKRSENYMEFDGKELNPQIKNTLRIWPMDNDTEGFYVARIRKDN